MNLLEPFKYILQVDTYLLPYLPYAILGMVILIIIGLIWQAFHPTEQKV